MAQLHVNGRVRQHDAESDTPLLWVWREQLGLTGIKQGCCIAQCGSCTVHIQRTTETGYRLGADDAPLVRDLIRNLQARFDCELVFAARDPAWDRALNKALTLSARRARLCPRSAWASWNCPACSAMTAMLAVAWVAAPCHKPTPWLT